MVLGQIEQKFVKPNEFVNAGQVLCKISSSKMELQILAKKSGRVGFVLKEGQRVVPGALVATVE